MMMLVKSHASAERKNSPVIERNHARRKSYVALLSRGLRGSVNRKFIQREKNGNRISFQVAPQPGDIYEIRRWLWDQTRHAYTGGTVYLGFDDRKKPFVLTREEAINSLFAVRVNSESSSTMIPDAVHAERVLPRGVFLGDAHEL